MKKQKMCKILLMLVVMVALAISSLVMVACPAPEEEHTEHTYGEWTIVTEATCTTAGSKEKVCSGCEEGTDGHKVTETIPALGHEWGEGTVTQDATYNTAGVKTFTCANDNTHTKTEPVAATGIPEALRGTWYELDEGVQLTVTEDSVAITVDGVDSTTVTSWDGIDGVVSLEFNIVNDDFSATYTVVAEYVAADADAEDDYEYDVFACEMSKEDEEGTMPMTFYNVEDLFTVTVNVNDNDFGTVYAPAYVLPGEDVVIYVSTEDGYEVESVMAGETALTYDEQEGAYVLSGATANVVIDVTFAAEAVEPPVLANIPEAFHGTWTRDEADGFYEFVITQNGITADVGTAGSRPTRYTATNIEMQGTDLTFTANGVSYIMFAPEGGTAMVAIGGTMPPLEFINYDYSDPNETVEFPAQLIGTWTDTNNELIIEASRVVFNETEATACTFVGEGLYQFTVGGVNYQMVMSGDEIMLVNMSSGNYETVYLTKGGTEPGPGPDVPGPGEDEEEYEFSGNQLGTWRGTHEDEPFVVVIEAKKVTINDEEYTDFDENGKIDVGGNWVWIDFEGNNAYYWFGVGDNDVIALTKDVPAPVVIAEGYRGTWEYGRRTLTITENSITLVLNVPVEATNIAVSADPEGYTFMIDDVLYTLCDLDTTNNTVSLYVEGDEEPMVFQKQGVQQGIPQEYHGTWVGEIYTVAISADAIWVVYGNSVNSATDIDVQSEWIDFRVNGERYSIDLPVEGVAGFYGPAESDQVYYEGEFEQPEIPTPAVTFTEDEQGVYTNSEYEMTVTVTENNVNVAWGFNNLNSLELEYNETEGKYYFYLGAADPELGMYCSLAFNGDPITSATLVMMAQNVALTKEVEGGEDENVEIDPDHYGVWVGETTLNNYVVRITLSAEGIEMVLVDGGETLEFTIANPAVIDGGYSFSATYPQLNLNVVLTYDSENGTFFADLRDTDGETWREATLTKEGAQPDPEPVPVTFTEAQQGTYKGESEEEGATFILKVTADAVLFGENEDAVTELTYTAGEMYPYSFTFDGTVYSFIFVSDMGDDAYIDLIIGDWEDSAYLYLVPEQKPFGETFQGTWLDDVNILIITEFTITYNDTEATNIDDWGNAIRFYIGTNYYHITVSGNVITLQDIININEDEIALYKEGTQPATFAAEQQATYADEDETYIIKLTSNALFFGEDEETVSNLVYSRRQAYPYSFNHNGTTYAFVFDGEAITLLVGEDTYTLTRVVEEDLEPIVIEDKTAYGYWTGTIQGTEYTVRVDETGAYINGVPATSYTKTNGNNNKAATYHLVVGGTTYNYSVAGYYKSYTKVSGNGSNSKYNAIAYLSDGTVGGELYAPVVRFDADLLAKYSATVGEGNAAVKYDLELKSQTGSSWLTDAFTLTVGGNKIDYSKHNGLVPLNLLNDNRNGWRVFGTDYDLVLKGLTTDYTGVYNTSLVIYDRAKDLEIDFGVLSNLTNDYDGTWYGTHGEDSVKLYFNEYGKILVTEDGSYEEDGVYCYDYTEGDEPATSFALKFANAEGDAVWIGLKAIADGSFVAVNLADNSTYSFTRPEGIAEVDSVLFGTWKLDSDKLIISENGVTINGNEATYVAESDGVYTIIANGVEYTFTMVEDEVVLTNVYKDTEAALALQVVFAPEYFGTWRDADDVQIVITETSVTYNGRTFNEIKWSRTAEGIVEYYAFDLVEGEGEEAVTTTHKISNLESETNIVYYNEVEIEVISASFDLTVGEEEANTFYYQSFPSDSRSYNVAAQFPSYYIDGNEQYVASGYYGSSLLTGAGSKGAYTLITKTDDAYFVMDGVTYNANTITLIEYEGDSSGISDSFDLYATYEFYVNSRSYRIVAVIASSNSVSSRIADITVYDAEGNYYDGATLEYFGTSSDRPADLIGSFYTDAIVSGEGDSATTTTYNLSIHNSSTTDYAVNFMKYVGDTPTKLSVTDLYPIYGSNNAMVGYGFWVSNEPYSLIKGEDGYTLTIAGVEHTASKFQGFAEEYQGSWKGFKIGTNQFSLTIEATSMTATKSGAAASTTYLVSPRAAGGYWFQVNGQSSYYNYIYIDAEGNMIGASGMSGRAPTVQAAGAITEVKPVVLDAKYVGTWVNADDAGYSVTITDNPVGFTVKYKHWAFTGAAKTLTLSSVDITATETGYAFSSTDPYNFTLTYVYDEATETESLTLVMAHGAGGGTQTFTLVKQEAQA